jgi:hypothetical protein
MSRRILSLIALAGFALTLQSATAGVQQKTLKEQLVGTFSYDITPQNGAKQPFYQSANPKGIVVLDATGRYASVQGRAERPKFKSASRLQLEATADEMKAAIFGFGANMGTWSVNEADKTLIRKYEIALIPNNDGLERKDTVTLSGDDLRLVQTAANGARSKAVYRRSK